MGRSPLLLTSGLGLAALAVVMVSALLLPAVGLQGAVRLPPRLSLAAPLRFAGLDTSGPRERLERLRERQRAAVEQGGLRAPRHEAPPGEHSLFLRPFGLHRSGGEGILLSFSSFAALASAAVVLAFLLPGPLARMREPLLRGPRSALRVALVGLLAYLFWAAWALVLTTQLVGFPLALFLLAVLLVLTLVGLVAVSLSLGALIGRLAGWRPHSPLWDLAAGLLVVYPLSLLPFVGWFTTGIAALMGLGAILVTRFGTGQPWGLGPLAPRASADER